jgi:hypothetical protein
MSHKPVTTLGDLLTLDRAEIMAGHLTAERGDPEPGDNHSRAYHHGWRTKMMDMGELLITPEHRELTRAYVAHMRQQRNEGPSR